MMLVWGPIPVSFDYTWQIAEFLVFSSKTILSIHRNCLCIISPTPFLFNFRKVQFILRIRCSSVEGNPWAGRTVQLGRVEEQAGFDQAVLHNVEFSCSIFFRKKCRQGSKMCCSFYSNTKSKSRLSSN